MACFVGGAAGDRPLPCVLLPFFSFAMRLRCRRSRCGRQWSAVGSLQPWELECTALSGPSAFSGSATRPRQPLGLGGIFAHHGAIRVCYERRGHLDPPFRPSLVDSRNSGRPSPERGLCSHLRKGHRSSFYAFSFFKYGRRSGAAVRRAPSFSPLAAGVLGEA